MIRSGPDTLGRDSIGHPSPGPWHREDKSLLFGGPMGLTRGCGKPGLHSWGTFTCLFAPEAGWIEKSRSGWLVSHDQRGVHISLCQINTPSLLGSLAPRQMRLTWLRLKSASDQGTDSHCWNLHRQLIRRNPISVCSQITTICTSAHAERPPKTCLPCSTAPH